MGNMGDLAILLVGIVDALFAFFVVAPILLNTASLFGVQKRFAQAMVEEGVIDETHSLWRGSLHLVIS